MAPSGNQTETEKTNIDLKWRTGEIPEGLSGSDCHATLAMTCLAGQKRNVENLGDPKGSWRERAGMRILRYRRGNPETKPSRNLSIARQVSFADRRGRRAEGRWGVRQAHSTRRMGKPCTRGRGQQGYETHKGNFLQTCWAGPRSKPHCGK